MFSTKMRVFTAVVLAASLVSLAFGQNTPAPRPSNDFEVSEPQSQTPAPQQRQPEYVEEKGFKGRVFEIKHRNPSALINALAPLGSGFKGATIRPSDEFNTITVRDFPENIAAMEEAIKRLDVPEALTPDIEFHLHVLIASNSATVSGEFPAELADVVRQLKATLNYKNYGLMTSSIQRGKEGGRVSGSGIAESKLFEVSTPQGNPIFFDFGLNIIVDKTASGAMAARINEFSFQMRVPLNLGPSIQYQNVGFRTPVTVRDGEKVVVGTTAIADKGLVVVLIAKFLK
jgi:hypothetical protein